MKYTEKQLFVAVQNSLNMSQVCRQLGINSTGNSYERIRNKVRELKLDTSHFLGQSTHSGCNNPFSFRKKDANLVLIKDVPNRIGHHTLKKAMISKGIDYKCVDCGISDWNNKPITLDIDHINGDWSNCELNNLRFLCPNCHRQTPTYGGKSKKTKIVNDKGFTEKQATAYNKRRKVIRPSLEVLQKEIVELGFVGTGNKYNVSDNSIRKWLKQY